MSCDKNYRSGAWMHNASFMCHPNAHFSKGASNLITRQRKYGAAIAHYNLCESLRMRPTAPIIVAIRRQPGMFCLRVMRQMKNVERAFRWSDCCAIIFQINQGKYANILATISTNNWAIRHFVWSCESMPIDAQWDVHYTGSDSG